MRNIMSDEWRLIPSEKIAELMKEFLELATGKDWEVKPVIENWDCYFEYKCLAGVIEDFSGKSRYIEDRDWTRSIDQSDEYDPIDQWASQFAYEAYFHYAGKCFDYAKKRLEIK